MECLNCSLQKVWKPISTVEHQRVNARRFCIFWEIVSTSMDRLVNTTSSSINPMNFIPALYSQFLETMTERICPKTIHWMDLCGTSVLQHRGNYPSQEI